MVCCDALARHLGPAINLAWLLLVTVASRSRSPRDIEFGCTANTCTAYLSYLPLLLLIVIPRMSS